MYYITSSDNTKIAVEDINNHSSKVIVMVHGWPISKEMFEYQKNILNEMGYRIISFDIRGFGDSDVSAAGYNYNQLATDLKEVVDKLHLNNITLMGFSMGGAICVHYMSIFNNHKVSKLILASSASPSYNATSHNPYGNTIIETNKLIMNLYNDRQQTITDFVNNMFALNHSEAFKFWFRQLCFKASGIGTIKTAIDLRDEDVFNDLSKINVPTLILHGKLDKICPYSFALIMHQEIKNSRLIPFELSGHGLFYDEMTKFNKEIINFMETYSNSIPNNNHSI